MYQGTMPNFTLNIYLLLFLVWFPFSWTRINSYIAKVHQQLESNLFNYAVNQMFNTAVKKILFNTILDRSSSLIFLHRNNLKYKYKLLF